jgi:hypothetical protein
MRMLVTVEFADAGAKSGQHRVLIIGRNGSAVAHGDIGLSLDDAQTLLGAIQDEFVEAQAAEIVELARTCSRCGGRLGIKDWVLGRVHTLFGRVLLPRRRAWPPPKNTQLNSNTYWYLKSNMYSNARGAST